jgi:antitoxin HicB
MKSLEEYKKLSYKAVVQYDSKEDSYFVEFPELPGCMSDATTATEAIEKALKAKDEWLKIAYDAGYRIPEPVGKFETTGRQTVRMQKSLHARVIERAEDEGVSQNQLIISFIVEGLAGTTKKDAIREELAEIRKLNEALTKLLADATSTFANPLFSVSSRKKSIYPLLQRGFNANTISRPLPSVYPGQGGATYVTADTILPCGENLREENQMRDLFAATEEGYQGGYLS